MNADTIRPIIHRLSDRIVEAQSPIRILDAIKWEDSVERKFFADGCSRQPEVAAAYYPPLPYDADELRDTFRRIRDDIFKELGEAHPASKIMLRMCNEYIQVIGMLAARGTPDFYQISRELYGSSSDVFHSGSSTLADLGHLLDKALRNIDETAFLEKDIKDIPTDDAVLLLQNWLDQTFDGDGERVKVIKSDGIVADAAAGSDYIKLREHAKFSMRNLRLLEAHEGWVHVGTTLNGRRQPLCTFLSKGTPSDTITQEGLAVFIEVTSFRSHPGRLRSIADRIRAIGLAEAGASFLDVFQQLCAEGRSEKEAYGAAVRVFRGSTPSGGPFTKDLAYSKGFVLVYNFIRLAVRRGRLDRIPLLFCGKLAIEDMGTISKLADAGLIELPKYLPPTMEDMSALTAWMSYSIFLNRLDLKQIDADFAHLFD
jgi:uncharacterized protein (TIGR02421 family)